MKTFKRYLKFKLGYSYGIENIKKMLGGSKGKGTFIVVSILIGFSALIMYGVLLAAEYFMLRIGAAMGNGKEVLISLLSMGQLIILFLGMFSVFGMMYGGKDSELIASLPIKSSYVFMGNLAGSYIPQLALSFAIILPIYIIYSLICGAGVLFWVYGILGILLYPVVPLVIDAILVMLFNSVTARFKHKELFGTIIGFLFIAGVVVFQMYINGRNNVTDEKIKIIISGFVNNVGITSNTLPGGGFLGKALAYSDSITGLLWFAALIGICVVLVLLSAFLGDKLYFSLLQRQRTVSTAKSKATLESGTKKSGVAKTFFKKEWKVVLGTPAYMINGLSNIVVGPIILFFLSRNTAKYGLPDTLDNIAISILVPIVMGMVLLFASMNTIWGTTISREGNSFWIIKASPVHGTDVIKGKFLAGYSMHVLYCIVTLAVLFIIIKIPLIVAALISLTCLIAGLYMVAVAIMLDIRNPKLEWKTETEAIKSNINGLFEILISLAISIVVAAPMVVGIFVGFNIVVSSCISLGIALLFAVIFYFSMLRYTGKKFDKISV